jgi:hypothetical protein
VTFVFVGGGVVRCVCVAGVVCVGLVVGVTLAPVLCAGWDAGTCACDVVAVPSVEVVAGGDR